MREPFRASWGRATGVPLPGGGKIGLYEATARPALKVAIFGQAHHLSRARCIFSTRRKSTCDPAPADLVL